MLRDSDHHIGLYENRDSQNPQITARRSAQLLEKCVVQFEMSLFPVYVIMENTGKVCNTCLLFLTFFDFEALTQSFHCYTFF